MADGLVNVQNQFSGLDMSNLIGGPLKAACDAQVMLAASTEKFIEDVGFDPASKDGTRSVRMTTFSFTRATSDPKGEGAIGKEEVCMQVPLLSIVKIPTLAIDEVNITFDMEVKSSTTSESSSDKSGELDATGGIRVGPFHLSVHIKGSIACHEKNTRSSDNSAKYHVMVHAKDFGMPEGLARMLDILATASAPVAIDSKTPASPQPAA